MGAREYGFDEDGYLSRVRPSQSSPAASGFNGPMSASSELWNWAFPGILWGQCVFNERGSFKVFSILVSWWLFLFIWLKPVLGALDQTRVMVPYGVT